MERILKTELEMRERIHVFEIAIQNNKDEMKRDIPSSMISHLFDQNKSYKDYISILEWVLKK